MLWGVIPTGDFVNPARHSSINRPALTGRPSANAFVRGHHAGSQSSRLSPSAKAAWVALVQRDSIYIPGDPDVGAPKVARFGFERRSFKEDVHIFALGLKASRNYMALLSAKLNQVRLDDEPHNLSGLAFAAAIINVCD